MGSILLTTSTAFWHCLSSRRNYLAHYAHSLFAKPLSIPMAVCRHIMLGESSTLPFAQSAFPHPSFASLSIDAHLGCRLLADHGLSSNIVVVAFITHRIVKKYAQLEREALTLIFGVKKFHKYLCGRRFTLQSDHRPLLGLLKQDRVISAMASAHIQIWALTLSNYEYKLEYMPGSRISHADCMSYRFRTRRGMVRFHKTSFWHSRPWMKLRSTQTKSRNGHLSILCSHKCDSL